MKIRIIMAAFIAAAGCGASAQSNLTLYGRIDMTVEALHRDSAGSPNGSTVNMASDTNYWGLLGSEALGNGQRAYFRLESGFQPNSGSGGGRQFDRESYVGWGSALGNLQLGGQFAPAVALTGRLDPYRRSMNGLIQNLMQVNSGNANRGTLAHRDNAVQYISPNLNGFTVRALYSFGNNWSGAFDVSRSRALALEYAVDRWYAALSWEGSQLARPASGGSLQARDQNTVFAGATYDFDAFKLHGMLLQNTLEGEATVLGYMAGLTVGVRGGTLLLSVNSRNMRHEEGSRATVYALGYSYRLSERTTVYTSLAYLRNGDQTRYNLWPDSRSTPTLPAGQSVTGLQVGIRHMF